MMKKTSIFILSLVGILASSCNLDNKKIEGHYIGWNSEHNNIFNDGRMNVHSYLDNDQTPPIMNDAVFVDFFRDGTYLMNFHKFEYGEYEIQDSIIILQNKEDKIWKLTYKEGLKKGQRKFGIFKENESTSYFAMKRIENSTSSDYPFILKNNEWRIKATKKETTNELIDRLQNHVQFMEQYINWCNEKKIRIKFHNLQSPMKVAGNGFQMINYTPSAKWCGLFVEENNCKESLDLLTKYFRSGKFEWASYKNQARRLTHGLSQIRVGLNQYRK